MTLFGLDGKPLDNKEQFRQNGNLSSDLQNSVKIEVNSAMDHIRRELDAEARHRNAKGLILYGILVAVNILLWFIGSDVVKSWTRQYVHERLDEPMMQHAADEIMTSKISPYVQQEVSILKSNIDSLGPQLHGLESRISEATDTLLFMDTIASAQSMSMRAFQNLNTYDAPNSKYASLARSTRNQVLNKLKDKRANHFQFSIIEEKRNNIGYSGPKSSEGLRSLIDNEDSLCAVADQVRRENIYSMIPLLIEAIKTNDDAECVDKAIWAIGSLTTNSFLWVDTKETLSWWAANSNNYITWRQDDYNTANMLFDSGVYDAALQIYESIIKLDNWADESRSKAILCKIQMNDLPGALELFDGFKTKGRPYELTARYRLDLATNNVSDAVSNIVRQIKDSGPWAEHPRRDHSMWQQINWDLYDRLMSGN